jgi:microcystin-dependent protein
MADAFTTNFNLTKPEQGFSVDTWGGKLNDNSDLIDSILRMIVPTGAIFPYGGDVAPSGFRMCDGGLSSRTTDAGLFGVIGTKFGAGDGTTTFARPDLRGQFLRGLDAGRGVDTGRVLGTTQADSLKAHNHTGTTAAGGAHTHTGSTDVQGSHTHSVAASGGTDVQGNHVHALRDGAGGSDTGSITRNNLSGQDYATGWFLSAAIMDYAGAHAHNVSVSGTAYAAGAHSHNVTIAAAADHTHTFTTANTGDTETRPTNVAVNFIIRL